MSELLKNAYEGWLRYIENGKIAVLLIAVLMFFWFRREACKEKLFLVYTTVMTVCCIFPVSGALLMVYQTRFYDYEWIWNLVPVTLMLAYGGVIVFGVLRERLPRGERGNGWREKGVFAGILVLLVAVILLNGGTGENSAESRLDSPQYKRAEAVLDRILESAEAEEICLWAPKEIMEYARALHGEIKLIYGRDMWEPALGAYSYEVYDETELVLYQWMSNAAEQGKALYKNEAGEKVKGNQCMKNAKEAGVNRILLPDLVERESVEKWAKRIKAQLQEIEGYYLLLL